MKQLKNLPLPTAGGTQLWTDHADRGGYRIQQHAVTGHWRLLDPENVRRAWGSREECQRELESLVPQADAIANASEHTVVLLHGLFRTRHCMKPLEKLVTSDESTQGESTTCIRFSYASTRKSISDHAMALREILEDQPTTTQFSFVGHSMGNIVVRHLVGDLERNGDPAGILPRCRAMVMLGPPNHGAAIARRLAPTKLYGWITGTGGLELGPQWDRFSAKLSTPSFPFLIIAGDRSGSPLQNPLVDGASDFVVSLEEAELAGAVAIETYPVLHTFLLDDAKIVQRTNEFLNSYR